MKGVKTNIKITNNLVSLPYTKDNPLIHTSNANDGNAYYNSLCTFEKGKKYLFCANCDGTLVQHLSTTDYTIKPFTLWIIGDGFYFCYAKNNLFSNARTRYIWQITWNIDTAKTRLRVNTYSDNVHDVTIHVWDIAIYKISE